MNLDVFMRCSSLIILLVTLFGCNQNQSLEKSKVESPTEDTKLRMPRVDSGESEALKNKRKFLEDLANNNNTVHVTSIRYISDADFNRYAVVTVENTTTATVVGINFDLEGWSDKECIRSYTIKKRVKLKPRASISFTQLLKNGDCEAHTVSYVKYVLKDGTLEIGV